VFAEVNDNLRRIQLQIRDHQFIRSLKRLLNKQRVTTNYLVSPYLKNLRRLSGFFTVGQNCKLLPGTLIPFNKKRQILIDTAELKYIFHFELFRNPSNVELELHALGLVILSRGRDRDGERIYLVNRVLDFKWSVVFEERKFKLLLSFKAPVSMSLKKQT
jgi:hypothetical protein